MKYIWKIVKFCVMFFGSMLILMSGLIHILLSKKVYTDFVWGNGLAVASIIVGFVCAHQTLKSAYDE